MSIQKELRLDVWNLRLQAAKPADYRSIVDNREEQNTGGSNYQEPDVSASMALENPMFQESKVFL